MTGWMDGAPLDRPQLRAPELPALLHRAGAVAYRHASPDHRAALVCPEQDWVGPVARLGLVRRAVPRRLRHAARGGHRRPRPPAPAGPGDAGAGDDPSRTARSTNTDQHDRNLAHPRAERWPEPC